MAGHDDNGICAQQGHGPDLLQPIQLAVDPFTRPVDAKVAQLFGNQARMQAFTHRCDILET
ncbi:hypothetical protein [Cypionkella sp.]|uniref:hypothetical protein n=1 Tax=Cypionkella sp. TaxID=2811411 RepID=UPI002AC94D0A|nr:hypothetical protein [Cypionkella sp.]